MSIIKKENTPKTGMPKQFYLGKIKYFIPLIIVLSIFLLSSCQQNSSTDAGEQNNNDTETTSDITEKTSRETTSVENSTTAKETTEDSTEIIMELIKPDKAKSMLDSDEEILLLDVRTQSEYEEIHIPGSVLIPVESMPSRLDEISEWKDKTIIIYCRTGRRSAIAAQIMQENGFSILYDLGGIYDWPYETA